jgi:L-amino acid N-acyltransferase YncA
MTMTPARQPADRQQIRAAIAARYGGLARAAGFRVVGIRERIGQHHGRWRDVMLIERRSPLL